MAFWDSVKSAAGEAKDALANAANDVTNSAKDYNEKSRLKRAISTEEMNINNAFRQMGEKIHSSNPAPPPGYEKFYETISKSRAEIERLKEELNRFEKK